MNVLALDIDGVVLDVRPSFSRIVQELSGATLSDIKRFKDNGGFNDDWELARAATAWVKAGKPPSIFGAVESWKDVVAVCGNDPGDLSDRCRALYRGYWRLEKPMVPPGLLDTLSKSWRVVACTGRDQWELDRAEELLQFHFADATTSEVLRKPNPQALLRLVPAQATRIVMLGDTEDDRRTAERARALTSVPITYHHVTESPAALLRSLLDE